MAKKRTKKDRLRSDSRRHRTTAEVLPEKNASPKLESKKVAEVELEKKSSYLRDIFSYDPQLIVKDLKKTFLVFIFILLVLLTVALLYT